MTDAAVGARPGRRVGRGVVPWLIVVALIVVVAAIGGRGGSGGPPYAPGSTSSLGAKALALLLGRLGAPIDETPIPPAPGSAGVVLLLQDQLDAGGHRQLLDWVRSGGTLVAADPRFAVEFAAPARGPGAGGVVVATSDLHTDCRSPAVTGVTSIDPADGLALRPPPGATGCFEVAGGGSFLVIQPLGNGELVLMGGPDAWTNGHLGRLDNSVLAANLLAPSPGIPLRWIVPPRAGGGHRSLLALVPPRVKEGLIQLLVSVALLALWRGRRLGRPVSEDQAVEVPGSELVVAVGNLLHQGGRLDDAAAILRSSLRRSIVDQLGVPPSAPPEVLADVVAARSGLDRALVLSTVAGPTPVDEAALVRLAGNADTVKLNIGRPNIGRPNIGRLRMGRQEMADVR